MFKRFFGDKVNRFNEPNGPMFKRCFGRLLAWLGMCRVKNLCAKLYI
jgi:hypothetical protein